MVIFSLANYNQRFRPFLIGFRHKMRYVNILFALISRPTIMHLNSIKLQKGAINYI